MIVGLVPKLFLIFTVLSTNMKNNFCCLIRSDTDENSTRRCLLRKIPVQLYDGLVFLIFRPVHHIKREIVFLI